jgi:predicted N-acetyltransferase YhbS
MPDLPLILEPATDNDAEPIERLNERVFGPGRFARTAYRIRETTDPDPALSFVARVGTLLIGASAMTPIVIGEASALLLGPLIVEPVFRSQGIGEALLTRSLESAKTAGWKPVVLVGDEPYYARGSSARRRARYRCWGRSIRPGSSPASSSLAPWVAKGAARGAYAPRTAPNPSVRGFNQSAHSVQTHPELAPACCKGSLRCASRSTL